MREDLRRHLSSIYGVALQAVDPFTAVTRFVRREGDILLVDGRPYDLTAYRSLFLVGLGKAGVPMAEAVEQVAGERLSSGVVIVKYGHGGRLRVTRVLEAGHPEPDDAGLEAAGELLDFIRRNVGPQDLLFVVISGGGSALSPAPASGITLADKKRATSLLLRSGATIHEMNALRKHLSRIKGGRLLAHARGAEVVALVLSDVPGDELSTIASGPTIPDPTTFADCLEIVERYGLGDDFPQPVMDFLKKGAAGGPGAPEETPKIADPGLNSAHNVIVASNILSLQAAAEAARRFGYVPLIVSSSIEGNTADIAGVHVAVAREVLRSGQPIAPPCCIISGGETTVRVQGAGKGGRNQEFALWCARAIGSWPEDRVLFASLGSDGTDGPTDAAGAIAAVDTERRGAGLGLSIKDYLARNDSYHFFQCLGDLIITGPTRTNVMDLRFILIA